MYYDHTGAILGNYPPIIPTPSLRFLGRCRSFPVGASKARAVGFKVSSLRTSVMILEESSQESMETI